MVSSIFFHEPCGLMWMKYESSYTCLKTGCYCCYWYQYTTLGPLLPTLWSVTQPNTIGLLCSLAVLHADNQNMKQVTHHSTFCYVLFYHNHDRVFHFCWCILYIFPRPCSACSVSLLGCLNIIISVRPPHVLARRAMVIQPTCIYIMTQCNNLSCSWSRSLWFPTIGMVAYFND